MSEEEKAPDYAISQEELEMALRAVVDYHQERGLSFAVVNHIMGFLVKGGNGLEIESTLNHCHKIMEYKNGSYFMEQEQMKEQIIAGRAAENDPAPETEQVLG